MATAIPKTYDSRLVVVSCGGIALDGFGDAEKVVLSPNEDAVTVLTGSDGETAISYNGNDTELATINLMQTSTSNDYLSSLALARTPFSFQIRDLNGTTLVYGIAWVQRAPDVSPAKTVGINAWQIGVKVSQKNIGGVPALPPLA
jgi:hypothetical protein